MFTTILDEVVNGWVLTIFSPNNGKEVFIYETLNEAHSHRARVEIERGYNKLEEVNKNAFTL